MQVQQTSSKEFMRFAELEPILQHQILCYAEIKGIGSITISTAYKKLMFQHYLETLKYQPVLKPKYQEILSKFSTDLKKWSAIVLDKSSTQHLIQYYSIDHIYWCITIEVTMKESLVIYKSKYGFGLAIGDLIDVKKLDICFATDVLEGRYHYSELKISDPRIKAVEDAKYLLTEMLTDTPLHIMLIYLYMSCCKLDLLGALMKSDKWTKEIREITSKLQQLMAHGGPHILECKYDLTIYQQIFIDFCEIMVDNILKSIK